MGVVPVLLNGAAVAVVLIYLYPTFVALGSWLLHRERITGAQWIDTVREQTTAAATQGMITELGVEGIRVDDEEKLPRYIGGVLARLQEVWVGRQVAEVKSKLQRMSPVEQGDEYHALFGDLVALESYRRSLLEQASGDDLTA